MKNGLRYGSDARIGKNVPLVNPLYQHTICANSTIQDNRLALLSVTCNSVSLDHTQAISEWSWCWFPWPSHHGQAVGQFHSTSQDPCPHTACCVEECAWSSYGWHRFCTAPCCAGAACSPCTHPWSRRQPWCPVRRPCKAVPLPALLLGWACCLQTLPLPAPSSTLLGCLFASCNKGTVQRSVFNGSSGPLPAGPQACPIQHSETWRSRPASVLPRPGSAGAVLQELWITGPECQTPWCCGA